MRFPRAIVFDIYGTLLRVESIPRSDADWFEVFGIHRSEFQTRIQSEIHQRHQIARSNGMPYPEIQWPEVVATVLPTAAPDCLARFERRTLAADGALELLAELRAQTVPLGLVSNAQAYTLDELREAGISPEWFNPSFFSFEQGFSKPDPDVFRWIGQQYPSFDPSDILIVGDRLDNDILPAQALGFATWHVTSPGLNDLATWLKSLPL